MDHVQTEANTYGKLCLVIAEVCSLHMHLNLSVTEAHEI